MENPVQFAGYNIPYCLNYSSFIADNLDTSYFDHNQGIKSVEIGLDIIIIYIIVDFLSSVDSFGLHLNLHQTDSCQIFT